MVWLKIRTTLITFVTIGLVFGVAAVIIAYGRGYRFDLTKKLVRSTGLMVVSSEPSGAQIVVDGVVKNATSSTLTLTPGWYHVSIAKEGFQTWEKQIRVQGEVVTKIDALLIPVNPSLTALSATGVTNPSLSPDGSRLAYVIPPQKAATVGADLAKPGIWILDLVDKPLGLNRDAKQIANSNLFNYNDIAISWSPDNKQILVSQLKTKNYFLLDTDKYNDTPKTVFDLISLNADWLHQKIVREKEKLSAYPSQFIAIATASANLLTFSPDETKVLYEATNSAKLDMVLATPLAGANSTPEVRDLKPNNYYVYDLREDKNYLVGDTKSTNFPSWLPTSKYLLIVQKNKLEIMDYDGTNRKTLYAGPFTEGFAAPWTNGNKIIILTNLNPSAGINNLYAVNLK